MTLQKLTIYHMIDIKVGCTLTRRFEQRKKDNVQKHGKADFDILWRGECTPEEATDLEFAYADFFKYKRGKPYHVMFNRNTQPQTIETKTKNSDKHVGKLNGMFGKTHGPKSIELQSNARKKGIVVDGIPYDSMREAALKTGISFPTLRKRCLSNDIKHKEYNYMVK